MRYGVLSAAALLAALSLALASCGHLTSGSSTAVNTSPPTQTTGPVTIATDHSAYNNTDTMKITIVNTLTTAIYAYDTQAGCSILALEVQKYGQWVASDALHCPLGRVAIAVKIAPGASYTATIGGHAMSPGLGRSLPSGTYRLVLRYYDAPINGSKTPPTATEVDSATLTVSGSVPASAPGINVKGTGTSSTTGGGTGK
jgi:hypothetical protein